MSRYTLTYFSGRGRAEPIRMLMAAANVDYHEESISLEDWPTIKATSLWGNLPMLDINGRTFGQSKAIALYLAEKFGFLGSSPEDRLKIIQIVEACSDLFSAFAKFYFMDVTEQEKKRLIEQARGDVLVPSLNRLDEWISDDGYFATQSVTLAEIVFYHANDTAIRLIRGKPIMEVDRIQRQGHWPKLGKALNNVEDHPHLSRYLRTRWTNDAPF